MAKLRESVNLRSRRMKNGGETLYLDYFLNGVRHREFLNLYLGKDKAVNENVMRIAQHLKSEKIKEVDAVKAGLPVAEYQGRKILLEDYAADYVRNMKSSTKATYQSVLKRLKGCGYTLAQVDKRAFSALLERIGEGVMTSTKHTYGLILRAVMMRAKREGLLSDIPEFSPLIPKAKSKEKIFLTLDELQMFKQAPYEKRDDLKEAFLFACFTGLRYSDICRIRYENIENGVLRFRQKKTEELVSIPLSQNALKYLPRQDGSGLIFKMPKTITTAEQRLMLIVASAGIRKHVTFHCARHTCATLMLLYGADILTVSKILGHTNVSTTQIYARVLDQGKRRAVNLIPEI